MLGGRMSNQDEEEVEEELAALEMELGGRETLQQQQPLPSVPDTQLPTRESVEGTREPERRQAMLA